MSLRTRPGRHESPTYADVDVVAAPLVFEPAAVVQRCKKRLTHRYVLTCAPPPIVSSGLYFENASRTKLLIRPDVQVCMAVNPGRYGA